MSASDSKCHKQGAKAVMYKNTKMCPEHDVLLWLKHNTYKGCGY